MMNDFLSESVFVRGLTRYLNNRFVYHPTKAYKDIRNSNLLVLIKINISVQNKKNLYRAYANAVQDDLWTALQNQAVQENVRLPATMKEIMVILKFIIQKEEITRFFV